MKLAMLGATGGTGIELVQRALQAGHDVQVLARTPEKITIKDARLTVIKGDAMKVEDVQKVVTGCDALLSCLGSGGFFHQTKETTFYSDTTHIMLEALRGAGVNRLIAITSSGVEHDKDAPLFYRALIRKLLMNTYKDMDKMEKMIEQAPGLRWTIVRPSYLTDGKSKEYRVRDRYNPEKGWMISRTDTAKYMLEEAERGEWIGKHPALAM